jgi:hypothetical protein
VTGLAGEARDGRTPQGYVVGTSGERPASIIGPLTRAGRVSANTPGPRLLADFSDRPRPDGWPERCASCGAAWDWIGFDNALGFSRKCGACDSDE